jgi:hypothetical protein
MSDICVMEQDMLGWLQGSALPIWETKYTA